MLAALGFTSILLSVTSSNSDWGPWWILVLGMSQTLAFMLAGSLSMGYRLASSGAILAVFAAAFVPGLLRETPLDTGAALALAAAGSLPMWAVAKWRFMVAKSDIAKV